MKYTGLLPIATVLLIAGTAKAELADGFNAPPSNCCLAGTAKTLADQLRGWKQLGRAGDAQPAPPAGDRGGRGGLVRQRTTAGRPKTSSN